MRHIFETEEIIPRTIFCKIEVIRFVPRYFSKHFSKQIFTTLISRLCIKRKLLFLDFVFFSRKLLIADAVLLVSEIETKKTILAVSAIITKGCVTAVFQIKTIDTLKTLLRINNVNTPLAFKRKNTVQGILTTNESIAVSIIFVFYPTMTEVTITSKPPVISIFTVFIPCT